MNNLHVETLRSTLLLTIKHILLGLLEILISNLEEKTSSYEKKRENMTPNLHSSLPKSQKTSLSTNGLDISARQLILGHDVLLQVDILGQCHAPGMNPENSPLCFLIRKRKLNLPVNPAWSDESRVQSLDSVGSHDHLEYIRKYH